MESVQDTHDDQLLQTSVLDAALIAAQPFPQNGPWPQVADAPYDFTPHELEGSVTPSETGTADIPDVMPNLIGDAGDVPPGYILVPQHPYVGGQAIEPRQVIFRRGGVPGVNLGLGRVDAIADLDDAEERDAFAHMGQKVTYRIGWPGYKFFSFAKNIKVAAGHITRAAIVEQVMEAMRAFVEGAALSVAQDADWQVGDNGIGLNDMLLLGIDIVSKGSAQPRVAVRAGA